VPPAWAAAGARWGRDDLLYLGEWRRGFDVGELRALFFDCQQINTLRRERNAATAALDAATVKMEALERSVYWYRRQLIAEARLGPMMLALNDAGHVQPGPD